MILICVFLVLMMLFILFQNLLLKNMIFTIQNYAMEMNMKILNHFLNIIKDLGTLKIQLSIVFQKECVDCTKISWLRLKEITMNLI